MSKVYFDTGALVKLYIVEPGSAFVQRQAQKARFRDFFFIPASKDEKYPTRQTEGIVSSKPPTTKLVAGLFSLDFFR